LYVTKKYGFMSRVAILCHSNEELNFYIWYTIKLGPHSCSESRTRNPVPIFANKWYESHAFIAWKAYIGRYSVRILKELVWVKTCVSIFQQKLGDSTAGRSLIQLAQSGTAKSTICTQKKMLFYNPIIWLYIYIYIFFLLFKTETYFIWCSVFCQKVANNWWPAWKEFYVLLQNLKMCNAPNL